MIVCYQLFFSSVGSSGGTVIIEISQGMSSAHVGKLLETENVIRSSKAFRIYARVTGQAKNLKAGEYELDPSKSMPAILADITKGRVKLWKVTIPEGYNLKEIAKVISEAGLAKEEDIIGTAYNKELLAKYGITGKNAEGYLYPETYHFDKHSSPKDIVTKLLDTFVEKVTAVKEKNQADSTLSFAEIVVLASIIEKETANPKEYRIISAVYNNRLLKKMKLQADPTVIYGLPNYDGNIRRRDLKYNSPYNTYVYFGLPPGPIANPSASAIEAAYNPDDVDFLYFVATAAGGEHYFSRTYEEHLEAVRKYQLGQK